MLNILVTGLFAIFGVITVGSWAVHDFFARMLVTLNMERISLFNVTRIRAKQILHNPGRDPECGADAAPRHTRYL